jgi:hypothetical protein
MELEDIQGKKYPGYGAASIASAGVENAASAGNTSYRSRSVETQKSKMPAANDARE